MRILILCLGFCLLIGLPFKNVSRDHLPAIDLLGNRMDVEAGDLNNEGDLDLFICNAFGGPFQLFVNDGQGKFEDQSEQWLPQDKASSIDAEYFDANG